MPTFINGPEPGPKDLDGFEIEVPELPELPALELRVPRVLVVDDAAFIRIFLKRVLASAGYQVADAASGSAALALLQDHCPDLITLDVTMPEVDGLDTLRAIRALQPNARVMMVSAIARPDYIEAALAAGAVDYMTKPLAPFDVIRTVERLLGAPAPRPLPVA